MGKNKSNKIKKGRFELAEKRKTAAFIIPSFIGVALFFVAPFFVVGYYSMIDNPISREFVFFDNFRQLFANGAFTLAAKNTAIFSLIAVPLAVVIPLLLAILLMRKIPFGSIFKTILISPLMVPIASIVLIFSVLFHYNGVANQLLQSLGLAAIDWFKSDWSRLIIVLLFLWKNIGYNMILFMSALANIPTDIIEASNLDGAGAFRTFFRIKLPYLFSTILFVTILSLINSFKVFREVYLLTGDHPVDSLYLLQHFMNNTFVSLDYQKLSSAAVVMCLVMIVIIGTLFFIDSKVGGDIEDD